MIQHPVATALVLVVAAALATGAQALAQPPVRAPQGSCQGQTPTIKGTAGDDTLNGTPAADVIDGSEGNDKLDGGDGADRICGGAGDDVLIGKGGDDLASGDAGADRVYGGATGPPSGLNDGADQLSGGEGEDRLHGGTGQPNKLNGGAALDFCTGTRDDERTSCEGAFTDFDPLVHGFKFRNEGWTKDFVLNVGGLGTVRLGSNTYGLCGGFAYAAADNFHANSPAPAQDTLPPRGSEIHSYLYQRQETSLLHAGAQVLRRFLEWQQLPNSDKKLFGVRLIKGVKRRTRAQFKKVRKELNQGRPVPLGVVTQKGGGISKLTHNHQLTAIGYFIAENGDRVVAAYDGNAIPGVDDVDGVTWLYTKRRRQYFDREGTERFTRFRGYFQSYYQPKKPPWAN